MNKNPVRTPGKGKLRCSQCLLLVSPKEGDWFQVEKPAGQQSFVCKKCEGVFLKSRRPALAKELS